MDDSAPDNKTWSLIAGVVIIAFSLWALQQFCREYGASLETRHVVPGVEGEEMPGATPAEAVCSKWLSTINAVGGAGIVCLLAAWLLSLLSHSSDLLRLASRLAVAGRLIALVCLGAVVLVLVLFNQY
ncbi:MAG: hypothetical protein GY719_27740 [bacterium]|nr:hypothetical protein [bacterium]